MYAKKWKDLLATRGSTLFYTYTNYHTAIGETTGCGVVEWFTYHFTTIKIGIHMDQLNQYWLQAHFSYCLYERIVTTHSISKWAYFNVRIYYRCEHMYGFIFSCYTYTINNGISQIHGQIINYSCWHMQRSCVLSIHAIIGCSFI